MTPAPAPTAAKRVAYTNEIIEGEKTKLRLFASLSRLLDAATPEHRKYALEMANVAYLTPEAPK